MSCRQESHLCACLSEAPSVFSCVLEKAGSLQVTFPWNSNQPASCQVLLRGFLRGICEVEEESTSHPASRFPQSFRRRQQEKQQQSDSDHGTATDDSTGRSHHMASGLSLGQEGDSVVDLELDVTAVQQLISRCRILGSQRKSTSKHLILEHQSLYVALANHLLHFAHPTSI